MWLVNVASSIFILRIIELISWPSWATSTILINATEYFSQYRPSPNPISKPKSHQCVLVSRDQTFISHPFTTVDRIMPHFPLKLIAPAKASRIFRMPTTGTQKQGKVSTSDQHDRPKVCFCHFLFWSPPRHFSSRSLAQHNFFLSFVKLLFQFFSQLW